MSMWIRLTDLYTGGTHMIPLDNVEKFSTLKKGSIVCYQTGGLNYVEENLDEIEQLIDQLQ